MKICSKCKVEKSLSEFGNHKGMKDGKQLHCKSCRKQYCVDNADKIRKQRGRTKKKYLYIGIKEKQCGHCDIIKPFDEFWKNKAERSGYQTRCKACQSKVMKEYKKNNPEIVSATKKKYRDNNPENAINYRPIKNKLANAKFERMYNVDVMFTSLVRFRGLVRGSFRRKGYKKTSTTAKVLGCSFEVLKNHLESQFTDGMSWKNMGEWHIDHILPLAMATEPFEVEILSYYKNLQPLWAKDNMTKGDFWE